MTPAALKRWLRKADEALAEDRLELALEAPDIAKGHSPTLRGRAWALRGAALRRQGNRSAAEHAVNHALTLDSADPWIMARVSVFLTGYGKLESALGWAERAVTEADGATLADARAARALALAFAGLHAEAAADWAAAVELARPGSPVQWTSLFNLAADLVRRQDRAAAELALELCRVVRRQLGHRSAPRTRGALRWVTGLAELARGRRAAAARHLLRAVRQLARCFDAAALALVISDYATVTGRTPTAAAELAAAEIADVETADRVRRLAAGLELGKTDRDEIAAAALAAAIPARGCRSRPP